MSHIRIRGPAVLEYFSFVELNGFGVQMVDSV